MGRTTIDLAGQKFGRLTVKARVPREHGTQGQAMWLCRCDCGTLKPVGSNALRSGATRSCGCLLSEVLTARNTTHGLAPRKGKARAYSSWVNMIRRCTHVDDPRYPEWGGRGITVCERWLEYPNFLADMGERPPGMTLERKDNDGPYCRENCIWATPHQQQMNSSAFKLTPDVIAEIKRLRAAGMTLAAIGAETRLHRQTVSRALSGKGRSRKPGALNGIAGGDALN
jgi:hypothetical protein